MPDFDALEQDNRESFHGLICPDEDLERVFDANIIINAANREYTGYPPQPSGVSEYFYDQ